MGQNGSTSWIQGPNFIQEESSSKLFQKAPRTDPHNPTGATANAQRASPEQRLPRRTKGYSASRWKLGFTFWCRWFVMMSEDFVDGHYALCWMKIEAFPLMRCWFRWRSSCYCEMKSELVNQIVVLKTRSYRWTTKDARRWSPLTCGKYALSSVSLFHLSSPLLQFNSVRLWGSDGIWRKFSDFLLWVGFEFLLKVLLQGFWVREEGFVWESGMEAMKVEVAESVRGCDVMVVRTVCYSRLKKKIFRFEEFREGWEYEGWWSVRMEGYGGWSCELLNDGENDGELELKMEDGSYRRVRLEGWLVMTFGSS